MTTKLVLTPQVMPRTERTALAGVQFASPAADPDAGRKISDALAIIRMDTMSDSMIPSTWQEDARYEIFEIIQTMLIAFQFSDHMVKQHLGIESRMYRAWVGSKEFKEQLRGLGAGNALLAAEEMAARKLAEILSCPSASFPLLKLQASVAQFVIREQRLRENTDSMILARSKKKKQSLLGAVSSGRDYGIDGPPPAVDLNPNPPTSWVDDEEPPKEDP